MRVEIVAIQSVANAVIIVVGVVAVNHAVFVKITGTDRKVRHTRVGIVGVELRVGIRVIGKITVVVGVRAVTGIHRRVGVAGV